MFSVFIILINCDIILNEEEYYMGIRGEMERVKLGICFYFKMMDVLWIRLMLFLSILSKDIFGLVG